mmetsp:Transcript_75873/g.201588  ORF Transcript_75873/g.201588 Transcript_75873/m.201588 type:complete len:251 (-) Transcript_75873:671-1423(-)
MAARRSSLRATSARPPASESGKSLDKGGQPTGCTPPLSICWPKEPPAEATMALLSTPPSPDDRCPSGAEVELEATLASRARRNSASALRNSRQWLCHRALFCSLSRKLTSAWRCSDFISSCRLRCISSAACAACSALFVLSSCAVIFSSCLSRTSSSSRQMQLCGHGAALDSAAAESFSRALRLSPSMRSWLRRPASLPPRPLPTLASASASRSPRSSARASSRRALRPSRRSPVRARCSLSSAWRSWRH